MKKKFIVEVDYEEKDSAHVLYDAALEVGVENLMSGYVKTNSIEGNFEVFVKEVTEYGNSDVKKISENDYIEGYEYFGDHVRKVKGWVDRITEYSDSFQFHIQADDEWKGARGTIIDASFGEIRKLNMKERVK
jgi:hypothetical protein